MNKPKTYLAATLTLLAALAAPSRALAQEVAAPEQFTLKAYADIPFTRAIDTHYAIPGIHSKSSTANYGLDFGWTAWQHGKNTLDACIGLGYSPSSISATLAELSYHYDAPAAADMDNETYVRYYTLRDLDQKISLGHITLPIYVTYRYHFSSRFSIHALAGIKLAFNVYKHTDRSSGSATAWGIYPQYDDLLIDATYMNDFGTIPLTKANTRTPAPNSAMASFIAGIGAGVRIYGPLSLEASIKYEAGLSNALERLKPDFKSFTAQNAPCTYTTATGTKSRPLTTYLTTSKLTPLSASLSLLYHF